MAHADDKAQANSNKDLAENRIEDTGGKVKPAEERPATSPMSVQNAEPEDAYLTGGQRNLQRRVLGLNVENPQSIRPAAPSPGLHSTGSFSGVANQETGTDEEK